MKKSTLRLIGAVLFVLEFIILYYLALPALSIDDPKLMALVLLATVEIIFFERFVLSMNDEEGGTGNVILNVLCGLPILFVLGIIVINQFHGVMFRSTDYASLIEVEEKNFEDDFFKIDETTIPMMDRDTAERLGDRRIGSMSDLVSQFVPANSYTQINIANEPHRVTPLEYAGLVQWFNNKDEGIPNYLQVDMVSGEVEIKEVEDGIKYSHSERFSRDVRRHLRFAYPKTIFRDPSFELDDDGHPFYVATTYENAFFLRQKEPVGVILLDAVTGDTTDYTLDDMPTWVDRVYSSDLIMQQLNFKGKYTDGFWNSLFQKRGVTRTTDGYNYLPMDDDIYLYTGVTSMNNDASNIGFYLVNMRTKDAHYYPMTSADEGSAMASAEGSLQQMRFTSTFPLLISLKERPYYISSLKDDSGLVRSYALVDAQDYQKVLTDNTVDGLIGQLFGNKPGQTVAEEVETEEDLSQLNGEVTKIRDAVISGNTVYYLMVDGTVYKANISLHDQLPFVKIGDVIKGETNDQNVLRTITLDLN